jgi:formamidopyrimidine-DNA glycosylase
MPELPEVETVRRELAPAMERARFSDVVLRRRDLRESFPRRFRERLVGQQVIAVERRAKYLMLPLSSGETLLMHLGMSGSFRVGDAATIPHDHVVFHMSSGAVVTFNDPRRFGLMDLVPPGKLAAHPALTAMGPEPLSPAFDGFALARACRGKKTSLKVALLDQRIVAGLGNIYASEALHHTRLSPLRQASRIATASGKPRPETKRLVAGIKAVLNAAIRRRESPYGSARFRVYEREGEPCLRQSCGGTIKRITQAGRSTFYCPKCQR